MIHKIRARLMAAALLLSVSGAVQADTFVFTAIPDQDESRLMTRFGQVADYLAAELGVEVRYIPVKSYAAAVTAFRNNEVQLAWFGGFSGVQAQRLVPGSRAIAQGVEDPQFLSYLIVHASTGIEPGDDFPMALRGKRFTFGSRSSTSGRLMPEYFMREATGETPQRFFSRVGFSGDHSATIALVQSGAWDAGVVNYKVWEQELREGRIDENVVRKVWVTPPYPDYHWVIRGDVDERFGEDFARRVQAALIGITDETLLAAFPRQGFIPASNDDYQPIIDTARALDLLD
ncbi:putative selenate ABC transporter substrate-binding protein [Isoalcanivorax indicus]|uniref:putative selenate ABC transporter substrate-binding protein n=1 Tax=Isoalcanivorax indicus TaxID=2202653 RepID=UPI000DB9D9C6|nr:putative selenate ABC transporter substrate-binding protein [Isoalcanivorax indicus]